MPEQNIPLAWMRKWAFDGEIPFKIKNEHGRMVWASKFKIIEVTKVKIFADDVPLFAVNAHSALVEALKELIPACGFIVDRDKAARCDLPAPWVGSFGFRYCEKHHKERVDSGKGEGWLDEAAQQGIVALALAEPKEPDHETTTREA